jgi:hypothetical protein
MGKGKPLSLCAFMPLCLYAFKPYICPDGEIGRHASLRGWCRQRCASSSLVLGTKTAQRNNGAMAQRKTVEPLRLYAFMPLYLYAFMPLCL